jgi:hypothetical protein
MKKHFTKLIKSGGRLREFNFRKLASPNDNLYHVDVSDDRGNRIIFKVRKENGSWKIEESGLPKWVYEVEENLKEAIED